MKGMHQSSLADTPTSLNMSKCLDLTLSSKSKVWTARELGVQNLCFRPIPRPETRNHPRKPRELREKYEAGKGQRGRLLFCNDDRSNISKGFAVLLRGVYCSQNGNGCLQVWKGLPLMLKNPQPLIPNMSHSA